MVSVLNKKHLPPDYDMTNARYCGRGSPYGNPFAIGVYTRENACDLFDCYVLPTLDVSMLRGKDLICYCAPLRCHCDGILKKANA